MAYEEITPEYSLSLTNSEVKAIDKSAKRYEKLSEKTLEQWLKKPPKFGCEDCPLCQKFLHQQGACEGCPVAERAGRNGCQNTPYSCRKTISEMLPDRHVIGSLYGLNLKLLHESEDQEEIFKCMKHLVKEEAAFLRSIHETVLRHRETKTK